MTCRLCGPATSRRLCKQCEIEERAEERARARKDAETEDDNEGGDDDDSELRTDGGCETTQSKAIDRIEAERRARQAARALDMWSRAARLDLLALVHEETSVTTWAGFESQQRSTQPHMEPAYRLTCRDCPFEGLSGGPDAYERLSRAKSVHQTAFGHEVVVEQTDEPADNLPSDRGISR